MKTNINSSIATLLLGVLFVFFNTTLVMQVNAQSVVSSLNNDVVEYASLRDDGTHVMSMYRLMTHCH